MKIPALCTQCGALFPSRLLDIGPGVQIKNLTLNNNSESCPHCGGLARAAEGLFSVAENAISIIKAPRLTKHMLQAFEALVRDAYNKKREPDEVAAAAETIDPDLGKLIRHAGENRFLYTSALLVILMAIKSCSTNISITLDVNQLIDQVQNTPPSVVISQEAPPKN